MDSIEKQLTDELHAALDEWNTLDEQIKEAEREVRNLKEKMRRSQDYALRRRGAIYALLGRSSNEAEREAANEAERKSRRTPERRRG